jgi:hypothetical protein
MSLDEFIGSVLWLGTWAVVIAVAVGVPKALAMVL